MLSLALAVSGCGARTTSGPIADRSVLVADQFVDRGFNNLYDVVQALRANWLNARGPDSFTSPSVVQVYLDDNHLGGIESLRAIDVRPIGFLRYFDGVSAMARWGIGHGAGVVYVSTRPMGELVGTTPP